MRQLCLFLCLIFLSFFSDVKAQYPDDYGESLRIWLKANLYDSEFSDLGYNNARIQMYSYTDEENDSIACVYTGFKQLAVASTFPNPINAEHIIPQSFYGSVSPMRSDIHNLRPSHQSSNSARSNYPLTEVDAAGATWYGLDGSGDYFSTSSMPSNAEDFSVRNGSLWEPKDDRKGDLARQVFYFFTMYPTQAGDISVVGDVQELYQWHLDDPVDGQELLRNDRIELVQGNRNPYIDYSGLVFDAWIYDVVLGCTYPSAINYNANANDDDGSCLFLGGSDCPADLDGNDSVGSSDLLILLGAFGEFCP